MMGLVKRIINHATPLGTRRRLFVRLLVSRRYWIGLFGWVGLMIARRFVDIRVGLISADRIGHFAADVGVRFAEEYIQGQSRKAIYWVEGQVSNTFWFELMRRGLSCHPIARHIAHLAPFLPKSENWFLPSPRWTVKSRDVDGLADKTGARPAFLPRENKVARNWLKSIGWVDGQPLVCVNVRDSKFLNTEPGQTPADHGLDLDAWSYHDYRNSNIQTFVPAMEWLADQGAFILRMGKTMDAPLHSNHPNIIDYAFHAEKSDFLDVWLFANCNLCISTGTGPDQISIAFGVPLLFVNLLPLSSTVLWSPSETAGKKLYNGSGKRLSLEDCLQANFTRSKEYQEAGIVIEDLNSSEILEIVKEQWHKLFNPCSYANHDSELRSKFVSLLQSGPDSEKHGFIHERANLSEVWVKKLNQEVENS